MTTIFDEILEAFRAFLGSMEDGAVNQAVDQIGWDMPVRDLAPHALACLRHLDRIAVIVPANAGRLVSLLARHRAALRWGQTYTEADFGRDFLDNYGWLEVFGIRGHFANDVIAAGFLVLGPGITYPDHHHVAEEFYIPLTGGTKWRMGDDPFTIRAAGEAIHHASNVSHAMRTGEDPLLALYIWRGGPLTQKSVIGEPQGREHG